MNHLHLVEMPQLPRYSQNDGSHGHPKFISPFDSVSRLVAARPARAQVFEKWNLGYCCGNGHLSLILACAANGVDYNAFLSDLQHSDEQSCLASGCDLDFKALCQLSSTELIAHIVDVHHAFLRRELPRLSELMNCVAEKHSTHFPELWELQGALEHFKDHLEAHLDREERELFPWIKQLASDAESGALKVCAPARSSRTNWEAALETLSSAQALIREQLRWMRQLTRGFTPSEGACCTYRVLLDGLSHVETDLRRHFAEEEHIVFALVGKATQKPEMQPVVADSIGENSSLDHEIRRFADVEVLAQPEN